MIELALAALSLAGSPLTRPCAPVTVYAEGSGAYTYDVRVSPPGAIGCPAARAALRRFVAAAAPPAGWICFRGHSGDAWAATCARSGAIVRAYGPKREQDPWRITAAQLRLHVLAPRARRVGLRLSSVQAAAAGPCPKALLTAQYGVGARQLLVCEDRTRANVAVGTLRLLGTPLVQGIGASLYDGDFPTLVVSLHGTWVLLQARGMDDTQLLAIAGSLHLVLV